MHAKLVSLALISIIILSIDVPRGAMASSSADPQAAWYDQNSSFRRMLEVTNPGSDPFINQSVVVHLTFALSHFSDALTEFKVFDSTGQKVPSFVLDQQYTDGYVSSVTLLFFANVQPDNSSTYSLYYGSAQHSLPPTGFYEAATNITEGLVSVQQVPTRPGSDQLTFSFGGTFAQTVISKLSYSDGQQREYGSAEISTGPYTNDTGWHIVGRLSSPSAEVATDTVVAGDLRFTRALVAYQDHVLGVDVVSNPGPSAVQNAKLTEFINSSRLALLGYTSSTYNNGVGLYSSSVASTLLGFQWSPVPSGYDVGKLAALLSEAATDSLLLRTSAAGTTAGVFLWDLGNLGQSGASIVGYGWTTGTAEQQLEAKLHGVGVVTSIVGNEEPFQRFIPATTAVWGGSVSLANLTLPSKGIDVPLTVKGGNWLPGTVHLEGEFRYAAPSPVFSPSAKTWVASNGWTGNASSVASPAFYSVDAGSYVARLAVTSANLSSTTYANLVSNAFTVFGTLSPRLNFLYQASFGTTSGLPANQTFYAALDIDNNFTGKIAETLLFPVAGSSTFTDRYGCGSSKISTFQHGSSTQIVTVSPLIADGTWRALNVSLSQWTPAGGFRALIRFCTASTDSFAGTMRMLLKSAYVSADGPALKVVAATMDYSSPVISIGYRTQGTHGIPLVTLNANLHFSVQTALTINVTGTTFAGAAVPPEVSANSTRSLRLNSSVPLSLDSLVMRTTFAAFEDSFTLNSLNETAVKTNGSVYSDPPPITVSGGKTPAPIPFSVVFQGYTLAISLVDANGNPIPGAHLTFTAGDTTVGEANTGSTGTVEVALLPWTYQMAAGLNGGTAPSVSVSLNGNESIAVNVDVYKITLELSDILHRPLPDAKVSLGLGSTTFGGFTDSRGIFSFQAVAGKTYHLVVLSAGSQIFQGDIKAAPNNAVVQVSTGYIPQYVTLAILFAIAAIVLSLGGVLYLTRRRATRSPLENAQIRPSFHLGRRISCDEF